MRIAFVMISRRGRALRHRASRPVPLVRPLRRRRAGWRPQLLFHYAGAMPLGHLRQRRRLRAQSIYDGRPVVTTEDGVRVKHRPRNY